ncbi:MAG: four helix bundle protein, partial [Saprospiraceae bacterium]
MENKYQSFEDLIIWKESMQLCFDIYAVLKPCRDYGLKDQIQRSAVSIPSNIAEGFERQTDKEFIRFLFIAKGSCGELRTQLYIANEQKNILQNLCLEFIDRA